MSERQCVICGCTDDDCRQCVEAQGHPCHWVSETLCSRCAQDLGKAFHDIYTRTAPKYGYSQLDSERVFVPGSPSAALMVAVITEWLNATIFKPGALYLPAED